VTSALDKSCNQDNFILRRDLQKLRHGGLPAGTIFWLKYRDSYRRTAPPTFTPSTAGPLAVRQMTSKSPLYHDFLRTSKSFAARPCNRLFAAKHMLFLPTRTLPLRQLYHDTKTPVRLPGLCRLDKFIMTRKLLPVNLDFAAKTL